MIIGAKENVSELLPKELVESKQLVALKLDLSSFESIREFAKEVSKSEEKIDLLINSANDFVDQNYLTVDGIEKNFAENYLGLHLLAGLLLILIHSNRQDTSW